MLRHLTLCGLVSAILISSSLCIAAADNDSRTLSDITIESHELIDRVRLTLEGNRGRTLGRVYYGGKKIRIVVSGTRLKDDKPLSVKGGGGLVASASAKRSGSDVNLVIMLNAKISSILEHVVFNPGLDASVIDFRKPAYFSHLAEEPAKGVEVATSVEPVVADDEGKPVSDVSALIPLVVPEELAEKSKPLDGKVSETDDRTLEKRKQALAELFDEDEKQQGGEEAKSGRKGQAAQKAKPLGIGKDAPDLTGLYLMAAIITLVGILWFLVSRGRRFSLANVEEPINVLKAKNLGGKQRLMVVEVEGRRMLLAASDGGIRMLSPLDTSGNPEDQILQAVSGQAQGTPSDENINFLYKSPTFGGVEPKTASVTRPSTSSSPVSRPSFFGGDGDPAIDSHPHPKAKTDNSLRNRLRSLRQKGQNK